MTARVASCSCRQLRLTCEGEPVRISICHCLECQKRTGGGSATFHFCPACGSTVYWELAGAPDFVAVAVGAFADPGFPPPCVSVYEERQHPWALAAGQLPLEHQF